MGITVRKMNNSSADRDAAAQLLIDSFYDEFEFLKVDTRRLVAACKHMFVSARFLLAHLDGKPAGMLAVSDNTERSCKFSETELMPVLGEKTARIAALDMEQEINMSLNIPADTGFIEYVATDAAARGKGVASALLQCASGNPKYKNYILEVFQDNIAAIRLYQKHGFVITDRPPLIPDKRKILMEKKSIELWR